MLRMWGLNYFYRLQTRHLIRELIYHLTAAAIAQFSEKLYCGQFGTPLTSTKPSALIELALTINVITAQFLIHDSKHNNNNTVRAKSSPELICS